MVETAANVNIFYQHRTCQQMRPVAGYSVLVTLMLIQIYEIQTVDEAQMMVDLGVDRVGSVLVSDAHWENPELKSTIQSVQAAGRKSSLIPLFGQIDILCRALDFYRPDIVHFCEALAWPGLNSQALDDIVERQQVIRDRYPEIEIMRSIPIGVQGHAGIVPSLKFAELFESISNWFLTDTLLGDNCSSQTDEQPVSGYVGITGKTCDWSVARDLVRQSAIPVILAGGLGPHNVADGIARVAPAGVDSCTLTNRVDARGKVVRFQKDPDKVKLMIKNARPALL